MLMLLLQDFLPRIRRLVALKNEEDPKWIADKNLFEYKIRKRD